jgi:hypothetical protein
MLPLIHQSQLLTPAACAGTPPMMPKSWGLLADRCRWLLEHISSHQLSASMRSSDRLDLSSRCSSRSKRLQIAFILTPTLWLMVDATLEHRATSRPRSTARRDLLCSSRRCRTAQFLRTTIATLPFQRRRDYQNQNRDESRVQQTAAKTHS